MKEYIGMNFGDWCALDEDDERKMYITLNNNKYESDKECSYLEILLLAEAIIENIDLINNEWHIELKEN